MAAGLAEPAAVRVPGAAGPGRADGSVSTSRVRDDAAPARRTIAFVGATLSFAVAYLVSSAPVPLYATYQRELGLTNADLSLSSVAYFVGTLVSLLVLARLSDHVGRRPAGLAAMALTALGCVLFAGPWLGPAFMAARFVQGLSCGLASSALGAYVVDTAPGRLAPVVTGSAPMIGLAAGSFGSGACAQLTGSTSTFFVGALALLVVCAALLLVGAESVPRTPGALRSLVPRARVPRSAMRLLPAAVPVFVGTWAVGGFFQAFSAPMAASCLGSDSMLVAAAVFACLQAPNVLGGMLSGRMGARTAQLVGMVAFLACCVAIAATLAAGLVGAFLVATACAGAAWGLAYTASMGPVVDRAGAAERAGTLSAIYLVSYAGAAVPNLVVGRLFAGAGLVQVAWGYVALVAVALLVLIGARLFSRRGAYPTRMERHSN